MAFTQWVPELSGSYVKSMYYVPSSSFTPQKMEWKTLIISFEHGMTMKLIEKIQEVLGILNFSNILTSKSSLLGLPSFLRPESPPTTPPGPEEPFGGVGECAQSHGEGAGFTEFRAFGNHEKMSGKGDRDGDRSCLEPRD